MRNFSSNASKWSEAKEMAGSCGMDLPEELIVISNSVRAFDSGLIIYGFGSIRTENYLMKT